MANRKRTAHSAGALTPGSSAKRDRTCLKAGTKQHVPPSAVKSGSAGLSAVSASATKSGSPDTLSIKPQVNYKERTLLFILPKTTHYEAHDFIDALQLHNVTEKHIVALGPIHANNTWHIVFIDQDDCTRVLAIPDLQIKQEKPSVSPVGPDVHNIRVHWAPLWITDEEIINSFKENIKVLKITHEVYPNTEIKTLVRSLVISTKDQSNIPFLLQVDKNELLITARGRKPICLRCRVQGHISRDCKALLCRICGFNPTHTSDQCPKIPKPSQDNSTDSQDYMMDDENPSAVDGPPAVDGPLAVDGPPAVDGPLAVDGLQADDSPSEIGNMQADIDDVKKKSASLSDLKALEEEMALSDNSSDMSETYTPTLIKDSKEFAQYLIHKKEIKNQNELQEYLNNIPEDIINQHITEMDEEWGKYLIHKKKIKNTNELGEYLSNIPEDIYYQHVTEINEEWEKEDKC